jgi:hypothetical protein
VVFALQPPGAAAASAADRIAADVAARRPLVAHVVVALCDNEHQGIVRVPRALGDGASPRTNLYWGARFGVRSFLSDARGWRRHATSTAPPEGVLERIVVGTTVSRGEANAPLYVVADAWDGRRMKEAIAAFFEMSAGRAINPVTIDGVSLEAGGRAHVVAFVGHDGLMDAPPPPFAPGTAEPARVSIVLACSSRSYFTDPLARASTYPLLLTSGFMAPEAYTLDAALRAWFTTGEAAPVHDAAARAYHQYQRCGLAAARRLFVVPR